MNQVHPTAIIDASARLAPDVSIGPFAVLEAGVTLGSGCKIGAHAILHAGVRMGARNVVHPHAVIGGLPQDLAFDPATNTWVELGDDNVLREGVTINRATLAGTATRLGSHNYLMNNAHIGHDGEVGDHTIFASGVSLGGHCKVGDRVFLGGGAMVHQFCRIGSYAMLQGLAGINRDVLPFTMVGGRPGKHYRLNVVGLRRAGVQGDALRVISQAFRALRRRESLDALPETDAMIYLRSWLAAESRRGGYLGFFELGTGENND